MDQFIQVYENVLSEELINELIDWADKPDTDCEFGESDGTTQFSQGNLGRNDYQKFLKFSNFPLMQKCHKELAPYLQNYSEKFQGIANSASHEVKLQKTPIGGGYSVWHPEQGAGSTSTRCASWLVYLNDVEEGGETEFLYQKFRQKPVKGTLVVWPAGFTHIHRGNPPYSNEKYVITGWMSYPYVVMEQQQ